MAARNVLLTHDKKAKVADFGLSTRLYINTSEQKGSRHDAIPLRWTAYEILRNRTAIIEFSDVWSFGVLMWEIFYLGSAIPYGNLSGYQEVLKFLENGKRLSKPPFCPQYVYEIMLECWMLNHLKRPTFFQLKTKLNNFAEKKDLSSTSTPNTFVNNSYLPTSHLSS